MSILMTIRQLLCIHHKWINYSGHGGQHRVCEKCKKEQVMVKLPGRDGVWVEYRREEW